MPAMHDDLWRLRPATIKGSLRPLHGQVDVVWWNASPLSAAAVR
jgi:hypothetical protein